MIKHFDKTGESNILDKTMTLFLTTKDGHITPVNSNIKYHFSMIYDHTFVTFFQAVKDLKIWNDASTDLNKAKVMFMLCDNEDGKILGYSKMCDK